MPQPTTPLPPMTAAELIAQRLTQTLPSQQHNAVSLAPQIQHAAACLFNSFLNDGKTVLLAPQPSQWLAQYWAQLLTQGFERERMGLPALAILPHGDAPEKAVYTHGRPNDVLLALLPPDSGHLKPILTAAREQAMHIVFIGHTLPEIAADANIILPYTDVAAFHEHLLTVCHSICVALDAALLDGLPL